MTMPCDASKSARAFCNVLFCCRTMLSASATDKGRVIQLVELVVTVTVEFVSAETQVAAKETSVTSKVKWTRNILAAQSDIGLFISYIIVVRFRHGESVRREE